MINKNTLEKAMSKSGISENELLSDIKSKAYEKPIRRIRLRKISVIAAAVAITLLLCSAGFAVIPAYRQYLEKRVVDGIEYTEIYTKEELDGIRNDLDGNYRLMSDITFTDEDYADGGAFEGGFIPIGRKYDNGHSVAPFTGIFDGNGHTVNNLIIDSNGMSSSGLFASTYSDIGFGIIMNLNLKGGYIKAGEGTVGGIAGRGAYIINCRVEDMRFECGGKRSLVGGVVGFSEIVDSCYSDAEFIFTETNGDNSEKVIDSVKGQIAGAAAIVDKCETSTDIPLIGQKNYLSRSFNENEWNELLALVEKNAEDPKQVMKLKAFYLRVDFEALETGGDSGTRDASKEEISLLKQRVESFRELYYADEEVEVAYLFDWAASTREIMFLNGMIAELIENQP